MTTIAKGQTFYLHIGAEWFNNLLQYILSMARSRLTVAVVGIRLQILLSRHSWEKREGQKMNDGDVKKKHTNKKAEKPTTKMWKDVHRKTPLPWTTPKHLRLQTGQKLTRKVDQWNRFRFKVFFQRARRHRTRFSTISPVNYLLPISYSVLSRCWTNSWIGNRSAVWVCQNKW